MSIWNKILLGLIFVASLVFFHAAARTVKTYQYWAQKTHDFEAKLAERRAEIDGLRTADHEHPLPDKSIGVNQLRIDLGRVLANRGRIWTKCDKQKAAPTAAGMMNVTVGTDDPNAFAKNMLLYGFEDDDQSPGKYLGEFRVELVGQNQVVLTSTTQLVASLAKNVTDSKLPWVLYEMMPTDEHEAFVKVPEDEMRWVPEEFVKDGQVFEKLTEDQKMLVRDGRADTSGKSLRQLRDYLTIFRACEMHRALYADRWESTIRDLAYLKAAADDAKDQEATVEKEKAQVGKEFARAKTELTAVANLLAGRQDAAARFQAFVQQLIDKNAADAKEIARLQLKAAELIDRRSREMAQVGPRVD